MVAARGRGAGRRRRYDGFPAGSEGIAFGPGGGLYVSTPRSGQVWRLDADGQAAPFAEVPDALGLAATADGAHLVASIGPSNTAPSGWAVASGGSRSVRPVARSRDYLSTGNKGA